MGKAVPHILAKKRRRHIFGMFRRQLFTRIAPVWLSFIGIDLLFRPDLLQAWIPLRLLPLAPWFCGRLLLRRGWVRRRYSEALAIVAAVVPALSVTAMVYMSGGAASLYAPGVILTVITGVSLFQLTTRATNVVNAVSYGAAIAVFWTAPGDYAPTSSLVMSLIFAAMILLNFITKSVESTSEEVWASAQIDAFKTYRRARRSEILSLHFPPELRRGIEARDVEVGRVESLDDCVVGFVDIVITEVGVGVEAARDDWVVKDAFAGLVAKRAQEFGLILPTHTGSDRLFIANYPNKDGWQKNTIAFFEALRSDSESLKTLAPKPGSRINLALVVGMAKGPVGIGFLGGKGQGYYSAIGEAVSLAARLVSRARPDELVIDQGVWDALETALMGRDVNHTTYADLGGFGPVSAFHVKPRPYFAD